MKVMVIVKPNAKEEAVVLKGDGSFVAHLKAPSREGKANARLPKVLASHFGVAPSCIRIVSGLTARRKIVEIS